VERERERVENGGSNGGMLQRQEGSDVWVEGE